MSVKKSLWLSGALVALGLLFLGCPTDADSSSEAVSYEQTALWAEVVKADIDLNSTYVTTLTGGNEGKDIVPSAKWVTQVQYAAFKRAIDEAREFAYTLGRAAAPTPAEDPYITALTAAQSTFDGQKKPGNATPVPAGGVSGNFPAFSIVTGEVTLSGGGGAAISAGDVLTVAPGATLTAPGDGTNTLAITGELRIKAGGTFIMETDGTNNVAGTFGSASGSFIVLESGATSIDKKPGGGSLTGSNKYATVVYPGAVIITYSNALGGGYQDVVMVGPSSGNNKGQILQLTSGVLKIGNTDEFTGYALDGTATLVARRLLPAVILSANSTLTVAGGAELVNETDTPNFLSNSKKGAKIVLQDATAYITYFAANSTNLPPLSGVSFVAGTYSTTIPTAAGYRITGPLVLVKSGDATTDPWVKQ